MMSVTGRFAACERRRRTELQRRSSRTAPDDVPHVFVQSTFGDLGVCAAANVLCGVRREAWVQVAFLRARRMRLTFELGMCPV